MIMIKGLSSGYKTKSDKNNLECSLCFILYVIYVLFENCWGDDTGLLVMPFT